MAYAIIRLAGKQYRVQEGDRILVDRLGEEEGKTFHPDVLLFADDGKTQFAPKGVQVTARVVEHRLGDKIRIGKYRPKTGYRRHAGHRSKQSEVEIQAIKATARKAEAKPKPAAKTAAKAPAKKPAAKGKKTTTAAKKPSTKRTPAKKEGS
jgi:large subunit ribosomal protein L21